MPAPAKAGAGQFAIGQHALCWVHAERLVHKLDTFTDQQRTAQQRVRSLIWQFYADLKDYRTSPTPRRRGHLRARFDYIFRRRTGFVTLDRLLQRLHANKAELLAVLDHPDIPLHTNGSETRHPLPGDQAQDQRWHPQRGRPRLPRCLPRLGQDLRQIGNRILGLSREQAWHVRTASRAALGGPHPLPRPASVGAAARAFAPITKVRPKSFKPHALRCRSGATLSGHTMTAIDRTAYPRPGARLSREELGTRYSLTDTDFAFIRANARGDTGRMLLATLLKTRQDLGYFATPDEVHADTAAYLGFQMDLAVPPISPEEVRRTKTLYPIRRPSGRILLSPHMPRRESAWSPAPRSRPRRP